VRVEIVADRSQRSDGGPRQSTQRGPAAAAGVAAAVAAAAAAAAATLIYERLLCAEIITRQHR